MLFLTYIINLRYYPRLTGGGTVTNMLLAVETLGKFSLSAGTNQIDDSENRSRKVWLLLAYLIYHRHRSISQEELIELLWGEETSSANPVGALKTTLHRARSALDLLFPSAGHDLIVRKNGGYAWNTDFPIQLDIERFDALVQKGMADANEESRLNTYLEAAALYRGDFLSKLSSDPWVVPIAAYYHNLYTRVVAEVLPLLEVRGRYEEAVNLCRFALKIEPYMEDLYQHLMRNLLNIGDQKGAATAYEEMSELLLSNFGIMPSEESRAIYREAIKTVNDRAIPPSMVCEQLREQAPLSGALYCDYDFFKLLYQVEARAIARSGDAIHIGLISLTGENNTELARRSLDRAMNNLQEQVCANLRKGDIASRCSVSQFILMLPFANYENSCMVCERIIKSFFRQYPHSPAELHYFVQPLQPNI